MKKSDFRQGFIETDPACVSTLQNNKEQIRVIINNLNIFIILAPEVLAQRPYGKEVDVWSIGVIAYIL